MKVRIEFETDNAAFEDDFDGEVAFVFERARAHTLETLTHGRPTEHPLRDSNGNTIGKVEVTE